MLQKIFSLDFADLCMKFTKEDYIVAPTVYEAVLAGPNAMIEYEANTTGGFFGVGMEPKKDRNAPTIYLEDDVWYAEAFRTRPITMNRSVFAKIQQNAF
jgi:hypothetical protein